MKIKEGGVGARGSGQLGSLAPPKGRRSENQSELPDPTSGGGTIGRGGSLERIFDEVVYRSLRPLALGLGIYYALLVPAHLYSLAPEAARAMAAVAGVSAAAYFGLLVWFAHRFPPLSWARPIEHGMAAIVLANALIHLHFVPILYQTTNIALAMLGFGVLLVSWRALAALHTASFAGWFWITRTLSGSDEWNHYFFVLVSALVLSILAFFLRVRGVRALEGAQSLAREIDLRQRAEAEQHRLEAQVRHAQKLKSLGLMASGIAHDFNNVLAGVLGDAELALDSLDPDSHAAIHLRRISRAAERGARLTRQLLAYSGKRPTELRRINVSDHVESMTGLLRTSLPKNVVFSRSLARDLPAIEADGSQIEQVALNLILNAGEAIGSEQGEVRLSTGVEQLRANFLEQPFAVPAAGQVREGNYVYLEVSDTGGGIPREDCERIFDPFFSTKFVGRGLGLAVVLGIIRGHRGALTVESDLGRGTTARAYFPACPGSAEEPPSEQIAIDPEWRGRGLILVVDDEEPVRSVAAHVLSRRGFETLTARDGEEALAVYRERGGDIDLVLLDLTMPRLDGEATLRELRLLNARVRVVFTSGYSERDVAARFAGDPTFRLIEKPFRSETLLREVRAALEDTAR